MTDRKYTRQEIIDGIIDVVEEIGGRTPAVSDIKRVKGASFYQRHVRREFGSIRKAREVAGLPHPPPGAVKHIRNARVCHMRDTTGATWREVGGEFGISAARARQIYRQHSLNNG